MLLRIVSGKLGAGWSKWLEVYKIQRLIEDRAKWKELGVGIYKKTGLGMFSEVRCQAEQIDRSVNCLDLTRGPYIDSVFRARGPSSLFLTFA